MNLWLVVTAYAGIGLVILIVTGSAITWAILDLHRHKR